MGRKKYVVKRDHILVSKNKYPYGKTEKKEEKPLLIVTRRYFVYCYFFFQ